MGNFSAGAFTVFKSEIVCSFYFSIKPALRCNGTVLLFLVLVYSRKLDMALFERIK